MSRADIALTFTVLGTPISKARPRTFVNRRGRTLTYTPPKTREFETLVAWEARRAKVRPTNAPVAMTLRFFRCRGDADNLTKSILDALNGIAYDDDRQVVELHVYVTRADAKPRTEITIRQVA